MDARKATGAPQGQKKRISFPRNVPNKVTFVKAPRAEERSDLWFQETEKIVSKPLVFDLAAGDKVSISIGVQVQITAIGCSSCSSSGSAAKGAPSESPIVSTLLVVQNDMGRIPDSLGERLAKLQGKSKKGGHDHDSVKWTSCGSVVAGRIAKVNVMLPRGEYLLRNTGSSTMTVFGQAADVERALQ